MAKKKNIPELLKDDSFLNWVNQSKEEDIAKWEAWRRANPDQEELLEDAKMLIKGFSFKKQQRDDLQAEQSWNRFTSKLEQGPATKLRFLPGLRRQMLKIAAVFLILAASLWAIRTFNSEPKLVVFKTDTNETKSVDLPDGSTLILNTNSSISYFDNWLRQNIRTIQLEGEAYFEVEPQPEGTVFQVQAADLTLEVIGTAFNCNSKRENTIVSLSEGKVNLIKSGYGEIVLEEGQTAWFDNSLGNFEIMEGQADYWQAWTGQKWVFDVEGTPMSEVIKRIEETFGLTSQLSDNSILLKRASGEVSIESREVLLEALSELLGLEMEVEQNQLLISKSDPED